ncbi:MAG: TolC family protein [Phycisphaerales bacterium]
MHRSTTSQFVLPGCLALLFACGCSVSSPDPAAERLVGDATGIDQAVIFRTEGGPLDEPDPAGATLTLADAVRRAVSTDPGLQAALARVRIALADADQSRLLPNPVLNVILRWGPGKPQFEVSLAQDFIQALQIPHRASAADNRLRQAASDSVTVAIDVVAEVQERYAAAQASAALVPILRERMLILERLVSVAKSRLGAGEGTRSDVATLNAQRIELQVEIDQALLSERQERLRLARLIGEPSSAAGWSLDSWNSPVAELPSEARWVDAALQQRPEIQSITWKLKALGDDEALVRLLPWEGASVGIDAQRDDKLFVGPSISTPLPIFDMGQAKRSRITAEQLEARHELTLSRRKVVEDVRVAYQTMAASNANLVRIRGELIPLQQQRRTLAEDAYRAGQSDVTVLFLAEQDLRLTQTRAIEVEHQAATSLIRLQRAVGGPGVASSLMPGTIMLPPVNDPLKSSADAAAAMRSANAQSPVAR